jgi:hypothetical protein
VKKLMDCLPNSPDHLFAFQFRPNFNVDFDGWGLYDPVVDFQRLELPNAQWKIAEINLDYALSATYPQKVCVFTQL